MKNVNQPKKPEKTEKPWKGICCEACWNAEGDRCKCSCGGKYHGTARKQREMKKRMEMKDAEHNLSKQMDLINYRGEVDR